MASKKHNPATIQIGLRMSPSDAKVAQQVARKLGLSVQNAIRFLIAQEARRES